MEHLGRYRNLLLCGALLLSSAVPATVQDGHDDEGLGDNRGIGTVIGDPNEIFGEVWLSFIDEAAGESDSFSNGSSADTLAADPDDVWDYAAKCYQRLKIDPADIAGPFDCKANGTLLYTSQKDVAKDLEFPKGVDNPNKKADGFPKMCDRPAWLDSSKPAKQHCYGHTYVQKLTFPNDKVTGALLCRHKTDWTLDEGKFDDIAMILHNKGNGETCWFQTENGRGVERNGKAVPAPHTVRNHDFWLPPSGAVAEACNECHDSGPWMNSRWMANSGIGLADEPATPYVSNGVKFEGWSKPIFVSVGKDGLKKKGPYTCGKTSQRPDGKTPKSCTHCHKISNQQTLKRWIPYTTGRAFPTRANETGESFDMAHWMPVNHECKDKGPPDPGADWKTEYDDHIDKLIACARAKGQGIRGCEVLTTEAGDDTARSRVLPIRAPGEEQCAGPGAQICGNYGGQDFIANASDTEETVVSIAPGSTLTMAWDGDAYDSCSIQATFPPAITVNNGFDEIGSGSNWVLSASPQMIGTLLQPGRYRFELLCGDQSEDAFAATLVFEVPGQELTVLDVQAIVGSIPGDRASNIPPDLPHTTVDARPADAVAIAWSTANEIDGSCRLTESHTGDFWDADSGFMEITLLPDAAQTYTLSCDGEDGSSYTVSTTVQVGPPLNLNIPGTCPGEVTVSVSGGTPGGRGGLFYSRNPGTDPILGGPCAGTATQLMSPRLLSAVTFDANGELVMVRNAPPGACGALVQVVDGTNCGVSNVASPGSGQPPLEGAPLCFKWVNFCDGVQVNAISPNGDITAEWYHYDCANNAPMTGVTGGDFVDPCAGGNTGTLLRSFAPNGPGDWYFNVDTPTDGTLDMAQGLHPGGSCWIDELTYNLLMGPCVGVKGQNRSSIQ